ncbi:MAG: hypothetical protein ACYDEY_16280 [Acidimicrobiales bacterium]
MPDPYELWRSESEGWVSVGKGPRLLARFQVDDKAMRNLSLVALTDTGIPGKDLAALFSITPEHLSRLRTRCEKHTDAEITNPWTNLVLHYSVKDASGITLT